MRKRHFLSLLFAAVLLCLLPAGCQWTDPADKGAGITVYYVTSEQKLAGKPLLIPQQLPLPREGTDQLSFALSKLFRVSADAPDALSAFPAEVTLLDYEVNEGIVTLHLSDNYGQMTGIDLTLADACAVMTLCGLPDINGVRLLMGDAAHPNRPEKVLTLTDISVDELSLKSVERQIVLCFKTNQNFLSRESRFVVLRENEPLEPSCLEELIAGPNNASLLPVLPPQTQFLSVVTERGVCYVNLPHEFFTPSVDDELANRLTLYAIVNTLTELPDVSSVQFLSEGEPAYFYGSIPVSEKLYRDETLLA